MNLHPWILQDHYRRWWWAHLVGVIVFGGLGIAVGSGMATNKVPLGGGAFLGALTVAVALNVRTNARTLLSLPIRASDLGTTLWWIAVPLSALTPTFGLVVGWLVSGLTGSTVAVDPTAVVRFLLLTQAVGAFQFAVLGFMPNAYTSDPQEKFLGGVAGAFWGIGFSGSCSFTMFWSNTSTAWDPVSCGILAMGAVCGLVSWNRRTAFLRQRARRNEAASQVLGIKVVLPKASRLDGFAGLYLRTLLRMAGIGCGVCVGIGGLMLVLGLGNGDWMRLFELWWVWASVAAAMTGLSSLRHWRTLPISADRLAWLLIGLHLTGSFGWGVPLFAIAKWMASQPFGSSDLKWLVLGTGLLAMMSAFLVRFGLKRCIPVLVVAQGVIPIGPILMSHFLGQPRELGVEQSVFAGVLLLFVAQVWMARTLRRQSRAFSPGFHQLLKANTGT